jgi:hypothetical protein
VASLAIVIATPSLVRSQESAACAHAAGVPHEPAAGVPPVGLVKAVLILAECSDQFEIGAPCNPDPWPPSASSGTPVPSWAPLLLQEEGETPVTGSITDSLLEMSNGQQDVRGAVYPYVVRLQDGLATWNHNIAGANNAVIDSVDNDAGFSFDDFDADSDGTVDQVIICYRQKYGARGTTRPAVRSRRSGWAAGAWR